MLGFGTARKQVQKLRVKGVAGRALKKLNPPRMPKTALTHYVQVLQADGGEMAKNVMDGALAAQNSQPPHALTSAEKTALLERYLPEEQEATKTLRKSGHKWLWRWIKRRDWSRFNAGLDELRQRGIPFDEVTYNLAIFGALLNRRQDSALAQELIVEMEEDIRFHPAFLRVQRGFLDSYFELQEVDAAPSPANLRKVAKTFWQISVNFKRTRVKEFRRRLADAASEQRRQNAWLGQPVLPRGQGIASFSAEQEGDQDDEDISLDMLDEEPGPRVKFPARRYPRHLRGAFKGSGVPKQRAFRWKLE